MSGSATGELEGILEGDELTGVGVTNGVCVGCGVGDGEMLHSSSDCSGVERPEDVPNLTIVHDAQIFMGLVVLNLAQISPASQRLVGSHVWNGNAMHAHKSPVAQAETGSKLRHVRLPAQSERLLHKSKVRPALPKAWACVSAKANTNRKRAAGRGRDRQT